MVVSQLNTLLKIARRALDVTYKNAAVGAICVKTLADFGEVGSSCATNGGQDESEESNADHFLGVVGGPGTNGNDVMEGVEVVVVAVGIGSREKPVESASAS